MASKARTAVVAIAILGDGVLTVLLLSGLLYEQAQRAQDLRQFPPLGRLVDIGGRALTLECEGTGQPTVILARGAPWSFYSNPKDMFENGAPRPGYGWVAIQRGLLAVGPP